MSASADPLTADADGDGLSDAAERLVFGTNPELADTDGDGMDDYVEAVTYSCLDPLIHDAGADPDADGLDNITELSQGTDPCSEPLEPVGGLVVDLDDGPLAAARTSGGSAGRLVGTIAGVAALAVALTGAAWYARRRL